MKLKTLNLPETIGIVDKAFEGAKIDKIILPKVKHIGEKSFSGVGIKISDLPSVKIIEKDAFSGCNNLETVNLPIVEEVQFRAFKDAPIKN